MSIHFRTLFEVEIEHAYYRGLCSDIDFVVPGAEQALAAGKLLTRVRDGRLRVLFEADDAGNALRDIHGATFLIGLRVANPYFANFTEAPVASGGLVLYGNRNAPRSLDPALAAGFIAPHQRIAPGQAARPLTLSWQYGGSPLVEQTLVAGQDEATFETREWPTGRYALLETAGAHAQTSHWLHSPTLAGEQLWGVVALTVDRGFYANPPVFRIALQARSEQLQYYVVARNFGAAEFGQLQLADAGAGEQGRTALNFDKITSDHFTDNDLPAASLGDAGTRIVLFQSQLPVARRAGGYRKLQLRRNAEVLVQHLPQAGSDRAQARFIVHLAKP
uniref:Uncharacterized protein n=1 Tax=Dechloromonas aromatica (strain RCB) TaxID=159087 RepID=Q479Y7_DECAR